MNAMSFVDFWDGTFDYNVIRCIQYVSMCVDDYLQCFPDK